jgi:hypothetical protein
MIGLVLAAAAVAAAAGQLAPGAVAGQLEVIPAATVEAKAGEAPLQYGKPPTAMLVEVVTPGVGLGYVGRRLDLLAGYQLRIAWQNTQNEPAPTPLLLHLVNLTMTARPTRRLVVKLTGTAYEGRTDYTYLPAILGQGQAALTLPPAILSANLSGSAELHVTELATAGIAVQAVRNQPLGEAPLSRRNTTLTTPTLAPLPTTPPPPPAPVLRLPYFTSFAATPGVAVRLSHADDLSSAVGVQYQHVSDFSAVDASGALHPGSAISAVIVSPAVGFHRTVTPHSEFMLRVGLAVTHLDSELAGTANSVTPIGSADLNFRLLNTRRAILQAKLTESVDYYLDPVLATGADHSFTTAALDLGLPKNWTIALEGSFVTPFAAHPQLTPSATPNQPPTLTYFDEVGAAAQLAARHLAWNELLLEFGGRWADRAPFFTVPAASNPGFHQRQLFLFVMLSGTTHPTWLPRREVASVQ